MQSKRHGVRTATCSIWKCFLNNSGNLFRSKFRFDFQDCFLNFLIAWEIVFSGKIPVHEFCTTVFFLDFQSIVDNIKVILKPPDFFFNLCLYDF